MSRSEKIAAIREFLSSRRIDNVRVQSVITQKNKYGDTYIRPLDFHGHLLKIRKASLLLLLNGEKSQSIGYRNVKSMYAYSGNQLLKTLQITKDRCIIQE